MRKKSESKRQSIVAMATEVFRENGFERASMSEICARVGGSKATLYSHFASKEELFLEVVFHSFEREFDAIYSSITDDQGDFPELLRDFGRQLLSVVFSSEFVPFRRLVFGDSAPPELRRMAFENGPKRGHDRLELILVEAMAAGKLRPADASVAAWQLQSLLQAEILYPVMMGVKEGVLADEVEVCVRDAVDVFMRAYAPCGDEKPA